ncbi:Dehydrogenase E1 component Transketolase pyrimidine binding domain [Trypanosoma vivax]|nr:putative 2-oxoglutarate dehydrogenase E1 component [Trypanosoma vivax]KAH8619087.1 Dehydrogenase E1 component Transketolase pyrimidine binding domain [Trypanosoma vivax]
MMRRILVQGTATRPLRCFIRQFTDAQTVNRPHVYDEAISAQNEEYIENLVAMYQRDPSLVEQSWQPVLERLQNGPPGEPVMENFSRPAPDGVAVERERRLNMNLLWMIGEYERVGHHNANVNPLETAAASAPSKLSMPTLHYTRFGFTEQDLHKTFKVSIVDGFVASAGGEKGELTLKEIVDQLNSMYCGRIGFEFVDTESEEVCHWFRREVVKALTPMSTQERLDILDDVVSSCGFEQFAHLKYGTQLRFGLDGGEALVPTVKALILEANSRGATSFIHGMAHRGRLNVLVNVLGKPMIDMFAEFEGKVRSDKITRMGDNKYHLGTRQEIRLRNGNGIIAEMLCNPSHLEAVNPLVLGKARARMIAEGDLDGVNTLPIIVHGDAAIAGLGSGHETMGLSHLSTYRVGGVLHIIVNNQVGFTTDSCDARSGRYCSDIAKINKVPVLHANGEDVEACVRAARIAARYRQTFHKDIVIDIVCYRRNGHNEADMPDFTQPLLYQDIRAHVPVVDLYSESLVQEGLLTSDVVKSRKQQYENLLREAYDVALNSPEFVKVTTDLKGARDNQGGVLEATVRDGAPLPVVPKTGVDWELLQRVGLHVTGIPSEMKKTHPVVQRTYSSRRSAIEAGEGIEWCLAEMLAFGTLALEGRHVRLSGEDVERGTFTQRHAVITDMETNVRYMPLGSLSDSQALVTVCNSSLSEFGVAGFELGYNVENPANLCMWEAQFGDFANGAQVIFDQFLCCGEEKWGIQSSLVLSLPHGYSGAGPEHSSARIERFLQLSNDTDVVPRNFRSGTTECMLELRIRNFNWQVCYPSTPANYFHMLRRQVLRKDFKPLVFFFSKARLRAPNVSSLAEMEEGTSFLPVIDTAVRNDVVARKVLFCTGQIESIVDERRRKLQSNDSNLHNDVVLVKLEQLSPFPWEQVAEVLEKYHGRNANVQFAWLQEEPKNMGAWSYVRPRFQRLLHHLGMRPTGDTMSYIGRPTAASPSTGYMSVHLEEEDSIIAQALS